jgi:hypothetical protein
VLAGANGADSLEVNGPGSDPGGRRSVGLNERPADGYGPRQVAFSDTAREVAVDVDSSVRPTSRDDSCSAAVSTATARPLRFGWWCSISSATRCRDEWPWRMRDSQWRYQQSEPAG